MVKVKGISPLFQELPDRYKCSRSVQVIKQQADHSVNTEKIDTSGLPLTLRSN